MWALKMFIFSLLRSRVHLSEKKRLAAPLSQMSPPSKSDILGMDQ